MSAAAAIARRAAAVLRAAIDAQRATWARLSPVERATTVMLGVMIAGGVVLRIQGIGWPGFFTFDEQHFVPNGRRYLLGEPDDNDHPPLGKLFIAVGILMAGDNPVGWRIASLIFGLQSIVIAYWLGRELFLDRRAGWMAAAFVAADGFFLAYSRTALLDGALTCLVLWSLLAAATAASARGVAACAVLVGLAASVKWSGALVIIPCAAILLGQRRVSRRSVLLLAAAPLVHVGLWLATFPLTGRPFDLRVLGGHMAYLFKRHLQLGALHNELASPWYAWPVLFHPIVVKLSDYGLKRVYASSAGNPLLFMAATAAVAAVLVGAVRGAVSRRARARMLAVVTRYEARAAVGLALGWLALIAPWTVARGTYVFMYHYFPSYGCGLVLLGGMAAWAERRSPRAVMLFVAVALALAIYFAPVWGEIPLREAVANRRLVFIPWRP
jgi:dolichyl-phosphate-mannose--protein O-mannosyl transferase